MNPNAPSCSYYRAAKAHQLLAQNDKAIEVLISALRNPELASDKGLNDALIETYGGLPNTVRQFLSFNLQCNDIDNLYRTRSSVHFVLQISRSQHQVQRRRSLSSFAIRLTNRFMRLSGLTSQSTQFENGCGCSTSRLA